MDEQGKLSFTEEGDHRLQLSCLRFRTSLPWPASIPVRFIGIETLFNDVSSLSICSVCI